jgi:Protein of unknown function (DUF2867)
MHRPVQSVPVPTDCVDVLPSADFSDSFAVDVPEDALEAAAAARHAFAEPPRWIASLLGLRNMLVAPLGQREDGAWRGPGSDLIRRRRRQGGRR